MGHTVPVNIQRIWEQQVKPHLSLDQMKPHLTPCKSGTYPKHDTISSDGSWSGQDVSRRSLLDSLMSNKSQEPTRRTASSISWKRLFQEYKPEPSIDFSPDKDRSPCNKYFFSPSSSFFDGSAEESFESTFYRFPPRYG